jgi:hypothetical protein
MKQISCFIKESLIKIHLGILYLLFGLIIRFGYGVYGLHYNCFIFLYQFHLRDSVLKVMLKRVVRNK